MEAVTKLFFPLIFGTMLVLAAGQDSPEPCTSADVGFMMDVSNRISRKNLERQKQVIQMLTEVFNVRFGGSRVGLITFNDKARTLAEIGEIPTRSEFNNLVKSIGRQRGRTRIDKALIEANNVLFGPRYLSAYNKKNKYLIILSTGRQSLRGYRGHRGNSFIKGFTRLLRYAQVRIIAVGLPYSNIRFLREIVASFKDLILVSAGRSRMQATARDVQNAVCSPAPAFIPKCLKKVDLGFALDASGSIGKKTFKLVRAFVIDTLERLKLSADETNAGVIVYSTKPRLVIKLNEFYDLGKFKRALSRRTPWPKRPFGKSWMNGFTRIDLALTKAKEELFTKRRGDRPNVPNALIFLTDGKQRPSAPLGALEHYAKPLINDNTKIYAVGFGRAVESELRNISSSPQNVFSYQGGAEVLKKAVGEIVTQLCNYCHIKVNLGFVLDGSRTASNRYQQMRDLVAHLAEGFVVKKGGTRAAVVTFSDKAVVRIPFTSDLEFFKIEADFLQFRYSSTFINKGLLTAMELFDEEAKVDTGRPNILIVVTDGKQTGRNLQKVREISDRLRKKKFIIIAVSTNYRLRPIDKKRLLSIAGAEENCLPFNKKIIDELVPQIIKKACPTRTLGQTQNDQFV